MRLRLLAVIGLRVQPGSIALIGYSGNDEPPGVSGGFGRRLFKLPAALARPHVHFYEVR